MGNPADNNRLDLIPSEVAASITAYVPRPIPESITQSLEAEVFGVDRVDPRSQSSAPPIYRADEERSRTTSLGALVTAYVPRPIPESITQSLEAEVFGVDRVDPRSQSSAPPIYRADEERSRTTSLGALGHLNQHAASADEERAAVEALMDLGPVTIGEAQRIFMAQEQEYDEARTNNTISVLSTLSEREQIGVRSLIADDQICAGENTVFNARDLNTIWLSLSHQRQLTRYIGDHELLAIVAQQNFQHITGRLHGVALLQNLCNATQEQRVAAVERALAVLNASPHPVG